LITNLQNIKFNRKLYYFIFLLFLFVPFNLESLPPKVSKSDVPDTTQKPIPVILSSDGHIYLSGLDGLKAGIKYNFQSYYLNILETKDVNLKDFYNKIKKIKPPFVITLGLRSSKLAQKYLIGIPILFSLVNLPRELELRKGNICGFAINISIESYFKTLKEISPEIRRVYSFYSSNSGKAIAVEGIYFDLKYNLVYKTKFIKKDQSFSDALESIKGKVDAFYIVPDSLYNKENFTELSKFCKANKVILMAPFKGLIEEGSTFGYIPNYNEIGYKTGKLANEFIENKKSCQDIGVLFPERLSFLLNEEYTKKSGIILTEQFKEKAQFNKILNIAINFFNKAKYKSAEPFFKKLLQMQPENVYIQNYYNIIISKLTQDKTSDLLKKANEYLEKKIYDKAILEFRKILDINPASPLAKANLKTAIFLYSEKYRKLGNQFENSDKPYLAISRYKRALRVFPGNTTAKNDLASIRQKKFKTIGSLLKKAIKLYKKRNYSRAIIIFDRILLISPVHKTAKEYLRLSKKKQIALEKLKNTNKQLLE
jgi:ABC-type uncharacterized transport system substrate-binding protein